MPLRPLFMPTLAALGLLFPQPGWCADEAQLAAAFLVSFGQPAPLTRLVQLPVHDTSDPPQIVASRPVTFEVRPHRLVALGGTRHALVSYETDLYAGHSGAGAIAISYLQKAGPRWVLQHLWPELLTSGSRGRPGNAGAEVHRFGGDPLFMARSEYCGMGGCSEWFGVVRLSSNGPVAYDDILAGADNLSPYLFEKDSKGTSCGPYSARARIGPPRHEGALFSVRYDGWTSQAGVPASKKPLHLVTSYIPHGTKLVMSPSVPVPTCGR